MPVTVTSTAVAATVALSQAQAQSQAAVMALQRLGLVTVSQPAATGAGREFNSSEPRAGPVGPRCSGHLSTARLAKLLWPLPVSR